MVSRRQFFALTAAGLLWPQKAEEMIVRSVRPEDLETPPAGFGDFITPLERFFVRTHVPVPKVDISEWRLKVEGHVATPLTLSLQDLRAMPSAEFVAVLECAGNGRAFFTPAVPGLQWEYGAVGNGRWLGVRLADVLKRAGVKSGAVEVLFDGADIPLGAMADFQRSIPAEKAMHRDTLLAYQMNGETLPVKHGFPLRAVVPGWAGDSWVKWVTTVRVLEQKSDGYWMKNAYLYPVKPIAPGEVVSPEAMTPVTSLRIKSVITYPARYAQVDPGKPVPIRGLAWSGDLAAVRAVDVSVDEGRSWKAARLTGPATQFGWRAWEFQWTPPANGRYSVLARARDARGSMQPTTPQWNPSGYLWNGMARVDLFAGRPVSLPSRSDALSPRQAPVNFQSTCLVCHEDDVIRQQPRTLTRDQWNREIDKMVRFGSRLRPEDRDAFLDYLSSGAAR